MIDKFEGKYDFLSNFYPSPIFSHIDETVYPTVEHYFQAQKSMILSERKKIAAAPTPGKAKYMGRHVQLRTDWEFAKVRVMKYALNEKFSNPELKEKLLATGEEELVEGNWWHDNYWGNCSCEKCKNISGKNTLGRLLMSLRSEYKGE